MFLLKLLMHFCIFSVLASILLVVTQDAQIFPGAVFSLFKKPVRDPKTLPPGVESSFIETKDRKKLEVWKLSAGEHVQKRPYIGLIFHGNGGPVDSFFLFHLWFQEMGITSYSFDFRGFGHSTGWPSEDGINIDSDTFYDFVIEKEKVSPENIIILGFSVGGSPAAKIAALHQPKVLLLISAFTNIKQAARDQKLVSFLAPFLWWKLPTIDYVKALKDTNLLLAHGEKDTIVPAKHTIEIKSAYQGGGQVERITSPDTGHNMVFYDLKDLLKEKLLELL